MKNILLFIFVLGFLFNCSSNDDASLIIDSITSDGNDSSTVDQKTILPIKIEHVNKDNTITELFSYDGDKLKEINTTTYNLNGIESGSIKLVYEYGENNISKISEYSYGKLKGTKEYIYSNGKVSKLIIKNSENQDVSTTVYSEMGTNQLIGVTNGSPISYTYTNDNLTDIFSSGYSYTAIFDNKNNPIINIKGLREINQGGGIDFSKNNRETTSSTTQHPARSTIVSYEYEYNKVDFPTKCIVKIKNYYDDNYNISATKYYTYNK